MGHKRGRNSKNEKIVEKGGTSEMTKTVSKWGNSLGIRLPQSLAMNQGLEEGSQVQFEEVKEGILIKPIREEPSLNDLLSQINDRNRHKEIDLGKEGKELF